MALFQIGFRGSWLEIEGMAEGADGGAVAGIEKVRAMDQQFLGKMHFDVVDSQLRRLAENRKRKECIRFRD